MYNSYYEVYVRQFYSSFFMEVTETTVNFFTFTRDQETGAQVKSAVTSVAYTWNADGNIVLAEDVNLLN